MTLNGKEVNERQIVMLIFSAIFVPELWLLLPSSNELIYPFRYHPAQGISLQAYAALALNKVSLAIVAMAFQKVLDKFYIVAQAWFWLQIIEVIDYFLCYNIQWFWIAGIGIGITLVKFLVLFGLIIWKFFTVK